MQKIFLRSAVLSGLMFSFPLALAADSPVTVLNANVKGTGVTLTPATVAGLPKGSVQGMKFTTTEQMKKTKGPTEVGVFMVDSESIPKNLQANLKEAGYQLQADGKAVDAKGNPIAVFVSSQTYRVDPKQKSGELPNMLQRFGQAIWNFAVTPAKAGNPYPFRCYTINLYAVYDLGGFCRWQRVHTFAEADGALADGTCGVARPETRISSISVRAGFLPSSISRRSCPNCSRASVSRQVGYGCLWPAIGGTPTMRHQVNMFDAVDGARIDGFWDWHL